ncbi:MAG: hypothetical protein CSA11_11955 [Chloroflexi bacterium]|nr:MAG: hypothetical protein CSA11_11955 [Chloroflexota bacterium]
MPTPLLTTPDLTSPLKCKRLAFAFAVMGGIFGEGIDLAGDRLNGVAIIGVGLPAISWQRELIREYFSRKTNLGYEYAYTYPGINRVLQAAGRVIRSENDRGTVLLIDDRFNLPAYQNLLPKEWHPKNLGNYNEYILERSPREK